MIVNAPAKSFSFPPRACEQRGRGLTRKEQRSPTNEAVVALEHAGGDACQYSMRKLAVNYRSLVVRVANPRESGDSR